MDWFLEEVTYKFTQEGNANGSTASEEVLSVTVESASDSIEKEGGFITIKTPTGWSINSADELIDILNIVMKGVPADKKS